MRAYEYVYCMCTQIQKHAPDYGLPLCAVFFWLLDSSWIFGVRCSGLISARGKFPKKLWKYQANLMIFRLSFLLYIQTRQIQFSTLFPFTAFFNRSTINYSYFSTSQFLIHSPKIKQSNENRLTKWDQQPHYNTPTPSRLIPDSWRLPSRVRPLGGC